MKYLLINNFVYVVNFVDINLPDKLNRSRTLYINNNLRYLHY